jgi:hypothetical protein
MSCSCVRSPRGWGGARHFSHKIAVEHFKISFADGPTIFRIEEYSFKNDFNCRY